MHLGITHNLRGVKRSIASTNPQLLRPENHIADPEAFERANCASNNGDHIIR